MPFGLPSEFASLGFLSLLFAAAFALAATRHRPATERVLPIACATLALQALHVGEEFSTEFHDRAPAMLGLPSWSPDFFIWVNLSAIALWLLALRSYALGRVGLLSTALLWFLAIASIGNAIWHPAISLATGAYFPGTLTAPFLGLLGVLFVRALSMPSAGGQADAA